MIVRRLEALPFRLLRRFGVGFDVWPERFRPIPMRDVGPERLRNRDIWEPISRVAPSARAYVEEFEKLWSRVVDVAIDAHADFGGRYAGAGPVDFVEAFVLYALVRHHKPKAVVEFGFASGISTWVLGAALSRNNEGGTIDTVDIKDNGSIVDPFWRLAAEGVVRPHFADARDFASDVSGYDLSFSDALHRFDFNVTLATLLRNRLPDAIHCYHEWSLAPHATREETRYVSMRMNLGSCGERAAFELAFPSAHYLHVGVPSSSGIGVAIRR